MNNFETDEYDTKRWYKDGELHREDGPAEEYANGSKWWYKNGKLHREEGPAIEFANGQKQWFLFDKLHREDGPAIERANGSKEWYKNGLLHREDGPAAEYPNGDKRWYYNNCFIHITKFTDNKIDKIYEEIFNEIFINSNKNDVLYLKGKFNLINIFN